MFRIECFCDDAKLAKIKWALYELGAYNVTDQPVRDTKPNGHDKPKRQNLRAGETEAALLNYIKEHKLKEIRAPQMREFAVSLGLSEKSYSSVLDKARRAGLLTKVIPKVGGATAAFWRVQQAKVKAKLKTSKRAEATT